MKLPKRFSLFTLLVVMLLVSLVFGCAQWRRIRIIREVHELNGIGNVTFTEPSHWRHPGIRRHPLPMTINLYRTIDPTIQLSEGFWPQVITKDADFNVQKLASGRYRIGNSEFSKDDAKVYLHALKSRLKALGINVHRTTVLDLEELVVRFHRSVDLLK